MPGLRQRRLRTSNKSRPPGRGGDSEEEDELAEGDRAREIESLTWKSSGTSCMTTMTC